MQTSLSSIVGLVAQAQITTRNREGVMKTTRRSAKTKRSALCRLLSKRRTVQRKTTLATKIVKLSKVQD